MAKNILYVAGAVFIILGLLGFVSDPVLGIFDVDAMHNIVHLVSGILAFVFASQGERQARMFSLVLGVVYALVTILGFMTGEGELLGLMSVNGADNWLHLVLAVVFLYAGLKKPAGDMASPAM